MKHDSTQPFSQQASQGGPPEMPGKREDEAPRGSRRRAVLVGSCVVLVLAGTAGAVAYTWLPKQAATHQAEAPAAAKSAEVIKTDLAERKTFAGTLGYGKERPVIGAREGTVTWVPKPGTVIDRGDQVLEINVRPVHAFFGETPLFRTLGPKSPTPAKGDAAPGTDGRATPSPGSKDAPKDAQDGPPERASGAQAEEGEVAGPGTVGRDVRVLEENLYALGYRDFGRPDDRFTQATVEAVKKWQRATGLKPTGTVSPGDVTVVPGASRIAQVQAQLGGKAEVGAELLTVSGTSRTVSVPMSVTDKALAKKGAKVTVSLPGGKKEELGKVTEVGTAARPAEEAKEDASGGGRPSGTSGEAKVTVTVTLDTPQAAGDLDGAPVSVHFASETRRGVLAVPVGALVALREGGYAVRVLEAGASRLIPVKTGMFAKGLVEVSSDQLSAGQQVVTTA
ncbi:peptidoglycan-binding protein [Streptomyces sp. VTCC 41912]|uniref:peptidoglycan-binding protein n=1 Tax=Streptomyces sp. VTCC 41912 TaxID=3383243 RepID=UPI003896B4D8